MDNEPRVMIIDDNPRARMALAACLSTMERFKIICEASNGADAIKKIESETPDLVLMDVQMPVMDGLEATRIIKRDWPQIKIVVLTMYPNYQSEAWSAGADGFLVKGCSVNEITSTIFTLLQSDKVGNFYR